MDEYDDETEPKYPENYVWHWLDEFMGIEGQVIDWDFIAKVLKVVRPYQGKNTSALGKALEDAYRDAETAEIFPALTDEFFDNTDALIPGEKVWSLDGVGLRAAYAAVLVIERSNKIREERDAAERERRASMTQTEREDESDRKVDEANALYEKAVAAQVAVAESHGKKPRTKRALSIAGE